MLSNRSNVFARDAFITLRGQLPNALHPLFDILERMRVMLIGMYSTHERYFDDSRMLDIVPPFVAALQNLTEAAKGVEIQPLHVPLTVGRSDMLIHVPNNKGSEEGMEVSQSERGGTRRQAVSRSNAFSDNTSLDYNGHKRRCDGSMGSEYTDAIGKIVDCGH